METSNQNLGFTKLKHKVLYFKEGSKIKDIMYSLREFNNIYKDMVFVTDKAGRYAGVVKLSDICHMDGSDEILNYLIKDHPTVLLGISDEKIANLSLRTKISVIPVLDKEGILRDVILPDTIIRILRKEHIEDLHKLAGIRKENSLARKALEAPPLRRARHRLPWLIVGVFGSILATGVMSGFDEILSANIEVSFFIPGIVYLADAVGTQTEAISIRGFSLSDVSFKKLLIGEMGTGIVIGLALCLICFPIIAVFFNSALALVVSLSILSASTVAASIGLLFPWALFRFKVDPAFGSGPLATIIQDILSILIYFLIVQQVLMR